VVLEADDVREADQVRYVAVLRTADGAERRVAVDSPQREVRVAIRSCFPGSDHETTERLYEYRGVLGNLQHYRGVLGDLQHSWVRVLLYVEVLPVREKKSAAPERPSGAHRYMELP